MSEFQKHWSEVKERSSKFSIEGLKKLRLKQDWIVRWQLWQSGAEKTPFWASTILSFLSLVYRIGYRTHYIWWQFFIKPYRARVPVISVGNIAVGGSGKSPMVKYLVSRMEEKYQVGVLSRAYRSLAECALDPVCVHPDEEKELGEDPARQVGDEPLMLMRSLPKAHFYLFPDRVASTQCAEEEEMEILVLDDGFQQRSLAKDLEIVMLQPEHLDSYLLPKGILREPPDALARADLIFCSGLERNDDFESLKRALKDWTHCPLLSYEMRPVALRSFEGGRREPVDLIGRKVGAFSGIANPQRFVKTLEQIGYELTHFEDLGDHAHLGSKELNSLCNEMKKEGAEFIVCTEKDFVKIEEELSLPLYALEVDLVITRGQAHLEEYLSHTLP